MTRSLTGCCSVVVFFALMIMVQSAGAYSTYSTSKTTGNCATCHGDFRATAPYISKFDGVAWKDPSTQAALNLHDGHRSYMLNGDCNVCHSASSKYPVSTNSSAGGAGFQAIGCSGCHNGDGLRAYHVNSGAASCNGSCHAAGTPPAENVKPPYYFTPDAAHPNKPTDPCNANGSESRVAPTAGLDNDGNLLDDAADPACKTAGDTTAPTVTAFAIPATSSSLVVPITTFTATDNVGVTGYKVTTSKIAPLAGSAGWTATPPKNKTFPTAGTKYLWAWAKDAAGNVSLAKSRKVIITLTDLVAPTVTVFTMPATSTTLTVPITALTAIDNVKVTGYKLTLSSKAPLAGATGWKWAKPASYTFKAAGTYTVYAWAKDAAGHVSNGLSATVTITLP